MESFEAKIFVGFKEKDTGINHGISECMEICQKYCDEVGLCVSVTETTYIYTNGLEQGAIIGLIQYPRFPDWIEQIKFYALDLAEKLMIALGQYRVTINFPDEVVMLSNPKFVKDEETSKL